MLNEHQKKEADIALASVDSVSKYAHGLLGMAVYQNLSQKRIDEARGFILQVQMLAESMTDVVNSVYAEVNKEHKDEPNDER